MLVTWNLAKNIEDRAIEVKGTGLQITAGINSNLNYISKNGMSYDLEYSFPLNFFSQNEFGSDSQAHGAHMSEGKDLLLG